MLSPQRFECLSQRQKMRELAKVAESAILKLQHIIQTPLTPRSLQSELTALQEYSSRLGGVAVVERCLQRMESLTDKTEKLDCLIRLEDALGVEAGLGVSEKEFAIRTTDVPIEEIRRRKIYLILDNIRSAFNVGGIFRTADAAGVSKIHICGYTPQPGNPKVEKTALGSTHTIEWSHWETPVEAIEHLKSEGVTVYGLETAEPCLDLFDAPLAEPVALVAGNEQLGLSQETLRLCDACITIPMYGSKNSLNVACATSIALYQVVAQVEGVRKSQHE